MWHATCTLAFATAAAITSLLVTVTLNGAGDAAVIAGRFIA